MTEYTITRCVDIVANGKTESQAMTIKGNVHNGPHGKYVTDLRIYDMDKVERTGEVSNDQIEKFQHHLVMTSNKPKPIIYF